MWGGLRLSSDTVSLPGQRRADFATLAPRLNYNFEPSDPELTIVYLARLGRLVVAGIQPEVESRFGARLRDAAPHPFELVTLINGAQKYLPGIDAYDRVTYEAMNSGFARRAEEQLEETILNLVKESCPPTAQTGNLHQRRPYEHRMRTPLPHPADG